MRSYCSLICYRRNNNVVIITRSSFDCRFTILDCEFTVNRDCVTGDYVEANEINSNISIRVGSYSVWSSKVTDDINLISSPARSIDVVLEVIVVNVATNSSLRNGIICTSKSSELVIFCPVMIDEWEEVDYFSVPSNTVGWGIIITAIQCNIALDTTIVVIESAILFKADGCANKANIVIINICSMICFVIVYTHGKGAVISKSNAVWIINFAVEEC